MSDREQPDDLRIDPSATPAVEIPAKRPWTAPVVSRAELITSTKKCYAVLESPVFNYGPS